MKLLEGKIAIVTGASRGIGKGIVRVFAENGCDIAFTYLRSKKEAMELRRELSDLGVNAEAYQSDASNYMEAESFVQTVEKDFGGIDVVVNNAGISKDGLLMRLTESDWDSVVKINMKSVFNITKCVQRSFLKQKRGSIINMSSVVGIRGNGGQSIYAASKAGIIGFTKSIALELGSRNIRCNTIAPGFIETEMTSSLSEAVLAEWKDMIPLKRPGTVEDVANLALFLASDLSTYITGQVISVCGGMPK